MPTEIDLNQLLRPTILKLHKLEAAGKLHHHELVLQQDAVRLHVYYGGSQISQTASWAQLNLGQADLLLFMLNSMMTVLHPEGGWDV